jgi:hypothetical protein
MNIIEIRKYFDFPITAELRIAFKAAFIANHSNRDIVRKGRQRLTMFLVQPTADNRATLL